MNRSNLLSKAVMNADFPTLAEPYSKEKSTIANAKGPKECWCKMLESCTIIKLENEI